MFATVIRNAPLFNRKEISESLLNFDNVHLIREIETILLPKSVLTIVNQEGNILEVRTEEYASVKQLYIDQRFVVRQDGKPNERIKNFPSKAEMIRALRNFPKLPYIWGGNVTEGIPELLSLYPPKTPLTPFEYNYYQLKGVDCSGLLYCVTKGSTLRNTSQIYNGYPQVSNLKPLDIIVWPGHMLIVLPGNQVIESRQYDGIVFSDLTTRLKEVQQHQPKYIRFL